jgi:uncharacterized protein
MRPFYWLFATALIAYLFVLSALYLGQRRLLYFPDRTRPELGPLARLGVREVSLRTEDRLTLYSWYLPPPGDAPVIVYFHGNGGHIGYRAERLRRFAEEGFGALLIEYRGYGGNPGTPSENGLYTDAQAAFEFLDGERIAADRRVLYGESLGSAVAVWLAARSSAAALILEAPFTSIAAVAQYHYPYVPAYRLATDRFDSLAKIGRVRAPLLLIHAEDDRVVPVRFGRTLYAAAPEPKEAWFTAQGGHDVGYYGGLDAAVAFVHRQLAGGMLDHAAK